MKTPAIITENDPTFKELTALAARRLQQGSLAVLTGAGISVESGIPDFRSAGGLWSVYDPDIYASLDTFLEAPATSWEMFRALANTIHGKAPNPAHIALAQLEESGQPLTIVTQNVDGLHQAAGSRHVLEIHGDHQHVQCLFCGYTGPFPPMVAEQVPTCPLCASPLKPNIILFGEDVRHVEAIHKAVDLCSVLLIIGTSANVYPASELPARAAGHGALLIEFNLEPTLLTRGEGWSGCSPHTLILGPAGRTVPAFCQCLMAAASKLP